MVNENPFKNIGSSQKEVPNDLKKKVMDEINSAKLIMEVADLFSTNYAATLESLFKTKKPINK